jgi:cytochrome c5
MDAVKVLLLIVAVALSGCGEPPNLGSREIEAASRTLVPQDAEIAAIYARSCASCHTVAATRAPLTGDVAAWAPRMAKGMDAMVSSVVKGFGGMPPFGLCMDCSAEQFEALIEFMATAAPAQ